MTAFTYTVYPAVKRSLEKRGCLPKHLDCFEEPDGGLTCSEAIYETPVLYCQC